MTPSDRPSAAPPWVTPYLPDFEDLLRRVELSGGFVLQPLEVPGPDLARAFADWLTAHGHPTVVREPENDTEWENITGWLLEEAKPAPEGVVMVVGSRDPPQGVHLAMRLVNQRRDHIGERLGCPLFWCGPASFLQLTREEAPDFWSVRAVERRLALPESELLQEARSQGEILSVARLTLKQVREALSSGELRRARALLIKVPEGIGDVDKLLGAETRVLFNEVARRQGRFHDIPWGLEAMDRAGSADHPSIEISQGRLDEAARNFKSAERCYRDAKKQAERRGERDLAVVASLRQNALLLLSDPEASLHNLQQGVEAAKKLGDRALAALATALLARAAARTYDRARAVGLLGEARGLAKEAEDSPTVLLPGEVEEALEAAERAISEGREDSPAPAVVSKPNGPPAPLTRSSLWLRRTLILSAAATLVIVAISVVLASRLVATQRPWCFIDGQGRIHCASSRAECESRAGPDGGRCQEALYDEVRAP